MGFDGFLDHPSPQLRNSSATVSGSLGQSFHRVLGEKNHRPFVEPPALTCSPRPWLRPDRHRDLSSVRIVSTNPTASITSCDGPPSDSSTRPGAQSRPEAGAQHEADSDSPRKSVSGPKARFLEQVLPPTYQSEPNSPQRVCNGVFRARLLAAWSDGFSPPWVGPLWRPKPSRPLRSVRKRPRGPIGSMAFTSCCASFSPLWAPPSRAPHAQARARSGRRGAS